MEQSPTFSRMDSIRIFLLISTLTAIDLFLLCRVALDIYEHGPSMMILFGLEVLHLTLCQPVSRLDITEDILISLTIFIMYLCSCWKLQFTLLSIDITCTTVSFCLNLRPRNNVDEVSWYCHTYLPFLRNPLHYISLHSLHSSSTYSLYSSSLYSPLLFSPLLYSFSEIHRFSPDIVVYYCLIYISCWIF